MNPTIVPTREQGPRTPKDFILPIANFGVENAPYLAAAAVALLVFAPGKYKLLALLPAAPVIPVLLIAAAMDT